MQPKRTTGAGPVRAADRLDRGRIVAAAIELLDKVGLDGLSLRRLATELGVQAPALYWHVKNKQELLDLMVEALVAREPAVRPLQAGEAWDEWVADRFRDMRRMLNRHRDGAMLTASTHPSDSQWPGVEMILETLVGLGLEPAVGLHTMIAAGNYVSGFTLEEQADRMRGHSMEHTTEADWAEAMAALAPYPLMTAAFRMIGDPQSDASFEAGLQVILDGLRKRVADAQRG